MTVTINPLHQSSIPFFLGVNLGEKRQMKEINLMEGLPEIVF